MGKNPGYPNGVYSEHAFGTYYLYFGLYVVPLYITKQLEETTI